MAAHILVIEDDVTIRESIVELLTSEDYQVTAAEHGQAGLDYLLTATALPDLILIDLMMPVMDGFAFCAAKAADPRLRGLRTVVMSADGHAKKKREETGAQEYMRKPVDIDYLLRRVAEVLAQPPPSSS